MRNVINSWLSALPLRNIYPHAKFCRCTLNRSWDIWEKNSQLSTFITRTIFTPQYRVNANKLTPTRADYHKNFRALAATVSEIWMEDPKNSQASSSDTLSLGRNRGPIWDPNFQPQHLPNFRGYPFPRVQARRPQLGLSIPTSISPLPLPFRGCGPLKMVKNGGVNCKIRPQWPINRCIQFLLQKCEIGVILSDMSRHARPTPSGLI